jgi:hypothetical protein
MVEMGRITAAGRLNRRKYQSMAMWRMEKSFGWALGLAGLALAVSAAAQQGLLSAPEPKIAAAIHALPDRVLTRPSQPPAFTIPIEPLGFSAPGAIFLGLRNSLASLDFIDENRLLFTFRVPGLMRRDSDSTDERQIRAVVVSLPKGTVEAEALWTVHDRSRYLWMLNDGHFLLRDRENLEIGDAALARKPFLRFPGPLLTVEMDPDNAFLVTSSREKEQTENSAQPDLLVRILRRDSGKVVLVSRSRSIVHLPVNSEGYLETLRGRGNVWMMNLNYFDGGSAIIGQVESACPPHFNFLSQRLLLATTCSSLGADRLLAITTGGRRLWEAQASDETVWPLMVWSQDGSRLIREALAVDHPVNSRVPLENEEIKAQIVEILNAADGRVVLETTAAPILDEGGNVALSPSGRRAAVLNAGAIQIFDLPAPPPLPAAAQASAEPKKGPHSAPVTPE